MNILGLIELLALPLWMVFRSVFLAKKGYSGNALLGWAAASVTVVMAFLGFHSQEGSFFSGMGIIFMPFLDICEVVSLCMKKSELGCFFCILLAPLIAGTLAFEIAVFISKFFTKPY